MRFDINLAKKCIKDNDKMFIAKCNNIEEINDLLNFSINEYNNGNTTDIIKVKISVLTRDKALLDGKSLKDTMKKLEDKSEFFKSNINTVRKFVVFGDRMNQLYLENSKEFDVRKKLIQKFKYSPATVTYNMDWLVSTGVFDEITADSILEIISESSDSKDLFSSIISKSKIIKKCCDCGKELHISNYTIGRNMCKECYKVSDLRRTKGDEAVKQYFNNQCKKNVEDSIKEFKNNSETLEQNELNNEVLHSKEFVNYCSQVNTIHSLILELKYCDKSKLKDDERIELYKEMLKINRALLETEENIYGIN